METRPYGSLGQFRQGDKGGHGDPPLRRFGEFDLGEPAALRVGGVVLLDALLTEGGHFDGIDRTVYVFEFKLREVYVSIEVGAHVSGCAAIAGRLPEEANEGVQHSHVETPLPDAPSACCRV